MINCSILEYENSQEHCTGHRRTRCLMTIGFSGEMMRIATPPGRNDYVYALLLVLSVVYLHWILRTFLMPIKQLPQPKAKELQDVVFARTAKGFYAGTIGTGYFLPAIHVFALLDRNASHRPDFLFLALFLIALGTFAQTRAVVENLCNALRKAEEKDSWTTGSKVG